MANPNMMKGAPSVNPSGMTKEQKEARDALTLWLSGTEMREEGKQAYRRCLAADNPAIVKDFMDRTLGKVKEMLELSQDPDASLNPHTQVTIEELKAIARAQLEKEKSLQPAESVK